MGAPYLERTTDDRGRPRVRFHDAEGGVWTVWDARFFDYKFHRVPHGDRSATSRVFVAANGTMRSAALGLGAHRELTADVLERQLRGAGYVALERFTPDPDAPGRPGGGTAP